ncbi:hypothetical protein V8C42DRAFT_72930 [Trichoderma barbatum]
MSLWALPAFLRLEFPYLTAVAPYGSQAHLIATALFLSVGRSMIAYNSNQCSWLFFFNPVRCGYLARFITNMLFLEIRNEDFPDEDEPPGSGRGMLLFSAHSCTTHMCGASHRPDVPRLLCSHMMAGVSDQNLRHGARLSVSWSESKVHGTNIQATLGFSGALKTMHGQCLNRHHKGEARASGTRGGKRRKGPQAVELSRVHASVEHIPPLLVPAST